MNYYRTSKFRHDEELGKLSLQYLDSHSTMRVAAGLSPYLHDNLPVLFIWGTKDSTATPFVIKKARKFVPRLQDVALEGRGHWLMIEAKDEITQKVINWLEELTSSYPGYRAKL